ncbi:unnamed protein product [Cuscuta europaea]|uniref:Uncharacterized protein n=1 Tax=Cuscuta europaea TaxID=41803 RepID=A0A9P0ZKU8_CUSEU|nr:unnamed protein product [Cuscuta europaea]
METSATFTLLASRHGPAEYSSSCNKREGPTGDGHDRRDHAYSSAATMAMEKRETATNEFEFSATETTYYSQVLVDAAQIQKPPLSDGGSRRVIPRPADLAISVRGTLVKFFQRQHKKEGRQLLMAESIGYWVRPHSQTYCLLWGGFVSSASSKDALCLVESQPHTKDPN